MGDSHADYWETPEDLAKAKEKLKLQYKRQLQREWAKLRSEWDELKRGNESWSAVSNLENSRYGSTKLHYDEGVYTGTSETGGITGDSEVATTGTTAYGHGSRAGIASRYYNDPLTDIDNIQTSAEMAEFMTKYGTDEAWTSGGHPAYVYGGKGLAQIVIKELKRHLKATADDNAGFGGGPTAATPPKDTATEKISRAGIAYDTIEYREQCFLLSQVFKIVEHKTGVIDEEEHKFLPYVDEGAQTDNPFTTNACLMVDANTPYGFINRLTQYPEQQNFINLGTPDLSQLQPQIRLFRVTETSDDSTGKTVETSQEMVFDTTTTRQDLEEFMKPTGKRGWGAGIKSFSVNYEASNPFALKKSISAELSIFANTFDELTRDRGGYSYIDLALKTGGRSTMEKYIQEHASGLSEDERTRLYNLSKLNFRLKAVVGWMVPPGVKGLSHSGVSDILNTSFVTINLTPTIHTFDFDDMGRVIFKIQYLAYIDDFFDEPSYSIFSDSQLIKEKMGLEVAKELAQARSNMWRDLKKSDKLRFINLKYSSLRKFQEQGAYFDLGKAEAEALDINNLRDAEKGVRSGLASAIKEYSDNPSAEGKGHKDKKNANSTQQIALVYFYVSDLLDIILKGIDVDLEATATYYRRLQSKLTGRFAAEGYDGTSSDNDNGFEIFQNEKPPLGFFAQAFADMVGGPPPPPPPADPWTEAMVQSTALDLARTLRMQENFRRYRCLLGPIEIVDPKNPANSKSINIGDLPISFKYFMEWLTGRTLSKDRPYYAISAFLNDFINGLINGFINDGEHCFKVGEGQSKQKTHLMQSAITAYNRRPNTTDTISQMLAQYRIDVKKRTSYETSRLHLHDHDSTNMNGDTDGWRPIKSWPILEMSGPPGSPVVSRAPPFEINYVCYYAGRYAPNERMNGRIEEDQPRGVMHYMAGKDRGIVKNIKFQKTETPSLQAVRYEQEGYDGLAQLREVYNVTIDTYANVCAFPGSDIFVNPKGLVPNMTFNAKVNPNEVSAQELSTYGIGGYYMIIRSSHKFGVGEANTTIDAVWVSEIAKKKKEKEEKKKVSAEEKKEKCQMLLKANKIASDEKKSKEPKDTVNQKKQE